MIDVCDFFGIRSNVVVHVYFERPYYLLRFRCLKGLGVRVVNDVREVFVTTVYVYVVNSA